MYNPMQAVQVQMQMQAAQVQMQAAQVQTAQLRAQQLLLQQTRHLQGQSHRGHQKTPHSLTSLLAPRVSGPFNGTSDVR